MIIPSKIEFKTIEEFPKVVGILEFDTAMLKDAKTDTCEFFDYLAEKFHVFLSHKEGTTLKPIPGWKALSNSFEKEDFHCDLVVATNPSDLAPGWEIR